MYGCECWTINKVECQRSDAFKLLCWRKLLRVPCTGSKYGSLSCSWLIETPWTAACKVPAFFIISQSSFRFMFIESVMLANHLILSHPLLLLPSVFPSIRVFSSESVLHIRWPKYWSFSFNINPSMNIQGWFPLELTGLISLRSSEEGNGNPLQYSCLENMMDRGA